MHLPRIAKAGLSIVLPVHEPADLPKVLDDWTAYLGRLKRSWEIIIVDDGSRPAVAVERERVRVLRHDYRQGFGAALRTGIAAAQFPLLFYTRADGGYRPADLGKLLGRLAKVHLVSGYRAGRPVPKGLRVTGFCWRWFLRIAFGIPVEPLPGWLGRESVTFQKVVRWLFGVRIGDTDSAFKLFRREIFDRIPIQSDGEFVHAEILAKANFAGCLMDELAIPVAADWRPDPHRWAELRRVFRAPDFGPALLTKRPAKAGA